MTSEPRSGSTTAPAAAATGSSGDRPGDTLEAFGYAIRPHNCFACGQLNAYGLHLELHIEPGRCWVELPVPRQFEGWEGIVHGGILSTILDEVMAWSLLSHDTWGVTARMAVTFRKPVEIGERVRADGWVIEARRRTFRTRARIVDMNGVELASAEGLYVAAPEDRKRELKERYGFRAAGIPDEVDSTPVAAAAASAAAAAMTAPAGRAE